MEFPTVFTRPDQIETAMNWCQIFLTQHLKDYRIFSDREKNRMVCPEDLEPEHDIIYLSAHMDTVDGDPLEWDEPFSPFSLYEDENQVVARGISNCGILPLCFD